MSRENAGHVQIFFGFLKYVCQACDFADLANRSHARGALSCECGVARPSVKGQPVDVKQSILHAWHQPSVVVDARGGGTVKSVAAWLRF